MKRLQPSGPEIEHPIKWKHFNQTFKSLENFLDIVKEIAEQLLPMPGYGMVWYAC